MSAKRTPYHVIVVDDVCRFALHLWCYFADVPGFGIGDISTRDSQAKFFWQKPLTDKAENEDLSQDRGKPHKLESPDGCWAVWWVEARGDSWKDHLERVVEEIGDEPACALVDVRGPARDVRKPTYQCLEVLAYLRAGKITCEDRILMISSYKRILPEGNSDGSPKEVFEKNASTFESIKSRFQDAETNGDPAGADTGGENADGKNAEGSKGDEPDSDGNERALHVLVTGAGFDMGGATPVLGLGTGSTAQILKDTLKPDPIHPADDKKKERVLSFPVLERLFVDYGKPTPGGVDPEAWRLFIDAAQTGDLDLYWEQFLRLELATSGGDKTGKAFNKLKASARERELREAFRSAIAHHDWGLTRQTVDALQTPALDAWLTTNYTRFPNRALDLLNSHGVFTANGAEAKEDEEPGAKGETQETTRATARSWRVIATSNEATMHLRQLLHEETLSSENADSSRHRFLFKLHGDIPHVTTMALAESDKEIYSPLSMPIDSLHWIYTTAEKHLERILRSPQGGVVWHLVGHGLKDRLLVELIVRVCAATRDRHHVFVVVGPISETEKQTDSPRWILERALETSGLEKPCVLRIATKAQEYMARLHANDSLLHNTSQGFQEALADSGPFELSPRRKNEAR